MRKIYYILIFVILLCFDVYANYFSANRKCIECYKKTISNKKCPLPDILDKQEENIKIEETLDEKLSIINKSISKNDPLDIYKHQEKLIISLTSYPARIKYVKLVLESLVNQSVPPSYYHIVLVLAIPEFPNKESDLPVDLVDFINNYSDLIEILWFERNIFSHKKLMPTLKKYPNNPILICDDDIIRKQWWIKMFLDDYKKYPNDIIFGASKQYLTSEYKWDSYKYLFMNTKAGKLNAVKNMIVYTGKPMNGFGGTLYPKNTFTDKRFFDEDLFMKLSPSSDESWQWCFNIIENKTIRQSSIIYDYSKDIIIDSQTTSLYKKNNKIYNLIIINFINEFPDFKKRLDERFKLINYKYCLCTILNDNYVIGFETLLYSFFKNNSWFSGDILVIHDDNYSTLSDESKKEILSKFPYIKFLKIDSSKYNKVNFNFVKKNFTPPLIKFEIFGLTNYDKVLYIDSDTLVLSNIYELFNRNEDLICFTHERYLVKEIEIWNNIFDGSLNTHINNGVIFINKNMLNKTHIDGMLNLAYKYDKTFPLYNGCPDQDIMQEYFLENNIEVTLGPNTYNTIKRVFYGNNKKLSDEKIVHYIMKKPWNSYEPEYEYINSIWHHYNNAFEELHKLKKKRFVKQKLESYCNNRCSDQKRKSKRLCKKCCSLDISNKSKTSENNIISEDKNFSIILLSNSTKFNYGKIEN